ncbi:putative membrane protein [Janibacter sp. HTCC2649]|uniref:glycosyltransferase 87 family protein n=1 Tax=Janibacter sp. HTCC2649 TaxID=313589 RepID=UPI0000670880|nr:glycosyltransferase 87 family protein [Janibacter sp. HTCC2649]EAQ00877.1 putative membrane protein [Janibacter sp. HTCC2649]
MPLTKPRPRHIPLRWQWPLAIGLIALAAVPAVLRYLVFWPMDQWQVDVEVYREAGVSILTGRPIYAAMTEAPQLLPFTYPPFAALLAIPLAWVPFGVIGWLWTAAQVAATTAIVWYAGWRLIHRAGPWVPLALAALVAPMLWLHPVSDGLRFGQVNAFMVLACLMDLRRPRPGLLKHVPPGVLVGLAMSIKLTPGVFVIHYLVNRRWREAATAVGTAVGVTLGSWVLLPEASFAFWGGALQDPARLGPNFGTSNQSMRGFLLRVGPEGGVGTAIWLVLVLVVGVFGFRLARQMWLRGDSIGEVAVVGLLACLLSPVAWIHHYHWIVVVIFALLGASPWTRSRAGAWWRSRRLVAGVVIGVWFLLRMPWWGITYLDHPEWPELPGRMLQNADVAGGLVALALLWWVNRDTEPAADALAADLDQADSSSESSFLPSRVESA